MEDHDLDLDLDLDRDRDLDTALPADVSLIPHALAADKDDLTPQSEVLNEISSTAVDTSTFAQFNQIPVREIKLSKLRDFYEKGDKNNALSLMDRRHTISIDDRFRLKMGVGQIRMNTRSSMIDYHLTVANCPGFSPLLPNALSHHAFEFKMDLNKQIREFKGKHATLGFDPAGRMLFIGTRDNEDVFLAMAPDEFLAGVVKTGASRTGRPSTRSSRPSRSSASGSAVMSRRHYRQTVMMLAHFLSNIPEKAYWVNREGVYVQDLDSDTPDFGRVTDVL